MAQILNAEVRNKAFLQYAVLFVITVILVIWAVYFNRLLPKEINRFLRTEIDVQRNENLRQEKFVGVLKEAKGLLDSLDKQDANTDFITMRFTEQVTRLVSLQPADSSLNGQLDKMTTETLQKLQITKGALKAAMVKSLEYDKIKAELEKCQKNLSDAQAQLDIWRKSSPAL